MIFTLVVAAAGIIGFLLAEARGSHPMMPLVLFRSAGMRIALLVGFALMAGWFGTVFFASLFLQQHLGLTPLQAGLAFLPAAIFSMAGNVLSGAITNRFGPRVPVVAGLLSMVVGLVALLITAPLGSAVLTAILLVFIGPGGVGRHAGHHRRGSGTAFRPNEPARPARCSTPSARSGEPSPSPSSVRCWSTRPPS